MWPTFIEHYSYYNLNSPNIKWAYEISYTTLNDSNWYGILEGYQIIGLLKWAKIITLWKIIIYSWFECVKLFGLLVVPSRILGYAANSEQYPKDE